MRTSIRIATLAALSCSSKPATPPATSDDNAKLALGCVADLTDKATAFWWPGCPVVMCGNSARINDSIIEALDIRGEQVQTLAEPFKLVVGSLQDAGGGCQGVSDLSLGVRDGAFIGVDATGAVKWRGAALAKARFKVTQPPSRPFTVRIAEIGELPVWKHAAGEPDRVPTYDLVTEIPGTPLPHQPLCRPAAWEPDIANLPETFAIWKKPSRHALLLQGETYKPDATVAKQDDRWFNIACPGGLAKLRMLGYDPMRKKQAGQPGGSTVDDRQATLKMLTGKYCGEQSWTKTGTPIVIRSDSNPGFGEPSTRVGPVEALWSGKGATCISHLRAWSRNSVCAKSPESDTVEAIRKSCGNLPACDDKPCAAGGAGDAVWRTCTVDHTLHP